MTVNKYLVLFLSFLWVATSLSLKAQKPFVHKYEWQMQEENLEEVVRKALKKHVRDGDNLEADRKATRIISTMLRKDPDLRFDFKGDLLFIKALYNPNRSFRIITWMFMQAPGYLIYRGVVQFKGKKNLLPLFDEVRLSIMRDNGRKIDNMNSPEKWHGALYDQIIPYTSISNNKQLHNKYLLLGSRKDHPLMDTKVADVLTIHNKKTISFGDFFDVPRSAVHTPTSNRFILNHQKNTGVTLIYDEKIQTIVFDILDIEEDEKRTQINNKMHLIPIGRYQGFKYKEDFGWRFVEEAFEQFDIADFNSRKKKERQEKKKEKVKEKKEREIYLKKKPNNK